MYTRRRRWSGLLILTTLLLAACASPAAVTPTAIPTAIPPTIPPPTSTPVSVPHPTGARDIVIQLGGVSGGMVASRLYNLEDQFPRFTLFGDGTAVYRTETGYYQSRLDEAAMARLLALAVHDVRFFQLSDRIGPACCDMPVSQVAVHADGRDKTVGMSILDDTDPESEGARLGRLLAAIDALRTGKAPAYQPAHVHLYAELLRGTPNTAPPAWPLGRLSLAAAATATESGGAGLLLSAPDAQAALQAAASRQPFTENGAAYDVVAVPVGP
ncbi:MAG TPA: hypothetical protein VM536_06745 [Chloroflexia bacterium]|nr:hypothetical protein [Chloroflexia bacterium]